MNFNDLVSQVLIEKLYGNIAVVYHRKQTPPEESIVFQKGIQSGTKEDVRPSQVTRARYGTGLYACYNLDDQLDPEMVTKYGKYIVKGKLDLTGFYFIDPQAFAIARPKEDFVKHLKSLNTEKRFPSQVEVDYGEDYYDISLEEYIQNCQKRKIPKSTEQQAIALKYWPKIKSQGFNGMIFDNTTDGNVAVIYNRQSFLPFAYALVNKKETDRLLDFPEGQREQKVKWIAKNPDVNSIKRPRDPDYDIDYQKGIQKSALKTKQDTVDVMSLHQIHGRQRAKDGKTIPASDAFYPAIKKIRRELDADDIPRVLFPNLEECGSIIITGANEIDFKKLRISNYIEITSKHKIELNSLVTCKEGIVIQGYNNSDTMSSLYVPKLKECKMIHADKTEYINARSLEKCEKIQANHCKEIVVSTKFEGKIKVPKTCKINRV